MKRVPKHDLSILYPYQEKRTLRNVIYKQYV